MTSGAEELVRLLADLVALDTANPPGNEEPACAFAAEWLAREGITSRLLAFDAGRCSLVAELPGREPGAYILSGHLDTVAPTGGWTLPPHELTERDDRLHGLGACDMKSGVAVLLHAFREIARRGRPRHTLRLLLAADEEKEYRGAALLQKAGACDGALFALEAEPSAGRILLGEPGEFWVRAHFSGREAHGSTPHEGHNAILSCARFLAALETRMHEAPPVPPFGPTTLNVGRIAGGRQVNIVPDACWADLDFRPGSAAERDRLAALLEEEGARACAGGGGFRWEASSWLRPCSTPSDGPIVGRLAAAYERVSGRRPETGLATFCTDLPTLFPGTEPPFVIFGPGDIRSAHQPDEFVLRSSLIEAAEVLVSFLREEL